MWRSQRVRAGLALGALAAVGLLAWACAGDGVVHEEQPQSLSESAGPNAGLPVETVIGEPGPTGEALSVTAPTGLVQSSELEILAALVGGGPANPVVEMTLVAESATAGPVLTAFPDQFDPGASTASWRIDRAVTADWPVGDLTFTGSATLLDGQTIAVTVQSYVAEAVPAVELDGVLYFDGETILFSCELTPPIPSTPIIKLTGTPLPGGPVVPTGTVTAAGGVLPPNVGENGGPVVGLTPAVAEQFSMTVLEPGSAEVEFAPLLYTSATVRVTVTKPSSSPPPPEYDVRIEGIIFNWRKVATSGDAMNVRMFSMPGGQPGLAGRYADDLIHKPLYPLADDSQEAEEPAWTNQRESTTLFYRQHESADTQSAKALYSDSAGAYSAVRTVPTGIGRPRVFPVDIRVLFRITHSNLTDDMIEDGTLTVPIRVKGEAKTPGLPTEFWDDQEFSSLSVRFDLTATGVKKHDGHFHSLEGARSEPTGPPGPGGRSIRFLRDNYVNYPVKVKRAVFDKFGFYDEKLVWEFQAADGTWKELYYDPVAGVTKDNKTLHRTYTMPFTPDVPWREVPFVRDAAGNERPIDTATERDHLLTDPALPWLHVLDELLDDPRLVAQPPQRPWQWRATGAGAVGGLTVSAIDPGSGAPTPAAVSRMEREIAERTTIYIMRHERGRGPIADVTALAPTRAVNVPYVNVRTGKPESWTEPKTPHLRYQGQARYLDGKQVTDGVPLVFEFSSAFFGNFSKKPRAPILIRRNRNETCACYDLAALNKTFARLLGSPLDQRTEMPGGQLNAPLTLWGLQAAGARSTKSSQTFIWHSYNTLNTGGPDERCYDVLVGTIVKTLGGSPGPFPILGYAPPPQPGGTPLTVARYQELVYKTKVRPIKVSSLDQELRIR